MHKPDVKGTVVGRFAPSPTGPLHVGSLVAALGSYVLARQAGGKWLLRMEDIDTPRVVPGCADDIMRTLEALGLYWDGTVLWQSQRAEVYQAAFDHLLADGFVYACACSRAEIARSATAPHDGEGELVYPGTCRQGIAVGREPRAYRALVPTEPITCHDLILGNKTWDLTAVCGDFVVRRADGPFAYQLAVVVDDAEQQVTQVVRGADLLSSTPRQMLLQGYLGLPTPTYAHLPLIVNADGGKLSKRSALISLAQQANLTSNGSRLLAIAASCLGAEIPDELICAPVEQVLAWLVAHLDIKRIPCGPLPAPKHFSVSNGDTA